MSDNLKDILNNNNKEIDNEKLLEYLRQELSNEDAHAIEEQMNGDEFINEAVEGLQQIDNTKKIPAHVTELHQYLHTHIAKNNGRKKRRWKDNPQIYIYIIALLILLCVSFFAIKKFIKKPNHPPLTTKISSTIVPKN